MWTAVCVQVLFRFKYRHSQAAGGGAVESNRNGEARAKGRRSTSARKDGHAGMAMYCVSHRIRAPRVRPQHWNHDVMASTCTAPTQYCYCPSWLRACICVILNDAAELGFI